MGKEQSGQRGEQMRRPLGLSRNSGRPAWLEQNECYGAKAKRQFGADWVGSNKSW